MDINQCWGSIKLFLDGSLCFRQGVGHGVDVWDQLLGGSDLRYWHPFCVCGEGLSPQCIQAGYWGDYSTCIIQSCVNIPSIVCLERPHEEQVNSAVQKQNANAVVRMIAWWAPHLEFVNFRRRLFLVFTFALVLRVCCLSWNLMCGPLWLQGR